MKVKIGPYKHWVGPYQIAEAILFWKDKYEDDIVYDFGKRLSNIPGLVPVCEWIHSKRKRNIKVHIDNYDVWNAAETMAEVILPVLKKMRDDKNGTPWTDHADGPWYYRFDTNLDEHSSNEKGSYSANRWDYIIGEIIWTFEQIVDGDWESRYHHGTIDIVWEPTDTDNCSKMGRGPKDTSWWDKEGAQQHEKAIDNGLRLFGKYYQTLWT